MYTIGHCLLLPKFVSKVLVLKYYPRSFNSPDSTFLMMDSLSHKTVFCISLTVGVIPNFKEILSLHISQEMKHSEGVKPIGGLVYMCQHLLWIVLRYFSSSLKNKVKITKNRDTIKEKSSKLSSCISQYIP